MTWMGYDTETREVFEFAVEDEDILQECARDYFPGTIYFEAGEVDYLISNVEGDMNWVEELFHSVILLRQFGEGLTPMTWREVETKMEAYLRRADEKSPDEWNKPAVTVQVDA